MKNVISHSRLSLALGLVFVSLSAFALPQNLFAQEIESTPTEHRGETKSVYTMQEAITSHHLDWVKKLASENPHNLFSRIKKDQTDQGLSTTPLLLAVILGHSDIAEFIAGNLVKIGHEEMLYAADRSGTTPLHIAAKEGLVNIEKYLAHLLPRQALSLTARAYSGRTPLHLAALAGHTEIVKDLAKRLSIKQLSLRDKLGYTAGDLAKGEFRTESEFEIHYAVAIQKAREDFINHTNLTY